MSLCTSQNIQFSEYLILFFENVTIISLALYRFSYFSVLKTNYFCTFSENFKIKYSMLDSFYKIQI